MKKLLTLAALVAAVTTQAASIQWTFSGITTSAKQIKDYTGTAMNGTLYLILSKDASSLSGATSKSAFEEALDDITLGTTTVTSGKVSGTTVVNSTALTAVEDNGPKYTFQVVVYDPANSYYYLSATKTEYAYDASAETPSPTSISFGFNDVGETYRNNGNIAWSPAAVPEPSTAALALAGLALLLKRRKA